MGQPLSETYWTLVLKLFRSRDHVATHCVLKDPRPSAFKLYTYWEYRPVAGQRIQNGRVQPLLCNRRINKHPFVSNGSVDMFPRKRCPVCHQATENNRIFLLGPPRGYITRTPDELQSVVSSLVESSDVK
jgi:hypothetical protein